MKIPLGKLLFYSIVVAVSVTAWQWAQTVSSESLSMALGLVFGVLAGIPAALLVLASQRRDADDYTRPRPGAQERPQAPHRIEYHTHKHLHVHGAQGQLRAQTRKQIGGKVNRA